VKRAEDAPTPEERRNAQWKLLAICGCVALLVLVFVIHFIVL
jgi:hypothetical protein